MSGVEILMIVAIVMQLVAMVIAMFLVRETKYSALWIACIIGLLALSVERILQLLTFAGSVVSNLTFAWLGILVSVCFSTGVVCARLLVNHVDRMTYHRRLLENHFMTALLRTEERSRVSISRDLHDGLGPLLSSAKMSLSALSRADLSDKDRATLQNTAAVIDEAIRSLREISNNLSPQVLIDFGLAQGVQNFTTRSAALFNIDIKFNTNLRAERFDGDIEVIIYRVICELINNSLKHSGCSEIRLSLAVSGDVLELQYSDNGRGFNPQAVMDCGMGLSNIYSRINSLNGELDIHSGKGKGMRASVKVNVRGATRYVTASPTDEPREKRRGNKKDKRR